MILPQDPQGIIGMSKLREIFDKYDADKGSKHSYEKVYEPLWEPLKDKEINILEIGTWKGRGIEAFLDYFPKANVYGIDIFTRVDPKNYPVYSNPRVKWMKYDSTDPRVTEGITRDFGDVKFDIILDDAMHTPRTNRLTFEHTKQFLKDDGMYIVEDVWPIEKMTLHEMEHHWMKKFANEFNSFQNDIFLNVLKHSGMKIQRFDNRKGNAPDSYVIVLTNE